MRTIYKSIKQNKMKKRKFQKLGDAYCEIARQMRKECIKYIKSVLKKTEGGHFEIDQESFCISVTYDGGRHPEYDSNVFSSVYGVFLEDGKIYLDIEDCGKYEIENVNASEVYDIAETMLTQLSLS